jgi:hypothetical protein
MIGYSTFGKLYGTVIEIEQVSGYIKWMNLQAKKFFMTQAINNKQ